jgi:CubicO group peptidase (beta-lactamase class C family)
MRPRMSLCILSIFLVLGCLVPQTQGFDTSELQYFPTEEWTSVEPESQNMSSAVLDELMQSLDISNLNMHGLVIVRNGYIVAENYWSYYTPTSAHHLYSVTKSVTSTLIGIAIKQGFIGSVTDCVLDYFPNRTIANVDSRKESMTIRDLLTMTPGVDWNEHNCSYSDPDNMYNQMFGSSDPVQFFLDLPMSHNPGEYWVYSTGASHVLSAILTEATGMSTRSFAVEYLFNPMNATCGAWNVDNQGINIGGTQLWITPRTMARLGLLLMNYGTWNGQELLTEEYADNASCPIVNGDYDFSYGYQWWVDTEYDYFLGMGSYGQYIIVSRDYDLVVAITANTQEASPLDHILPYLQRALLDWQGLSGLSLSDLLVLTGGMFLASAVVFGVWYYVRRRTRTSSS